ncbi:MAG: DUF2461 domain-containing protein [Bacteroidota bacterium]|nr:DUF2461 domain-containing protein [Bacteroidota bacterium]
MIHSSTLGFLKTLKKHNHKTWFDAHRTGYLAAKADFEAFVQNLLDHTVKLDEDLRSLVVKDCVFRINRDVRFSKDKSPYKTNMGAYLNKGGKKAPFAGYYFHLEPGGKSFAGGGLWMPEGTALKAVRQEIDYSQAEFRKIITAPSFKKQYGDLDRSSGYSLVNVPRGYEKDHPLADYLKLKSFVALRPLPDTLLSDKKLGKEVLDAFRALYPLVKFLNRAID